MFKVGDQVIKKKPGTFIPAGTCGVVDGLYHNYVSVRWDGLGRYSYLIEKAHAYLQVNGLQQAINRNRDVK